MSALSEGYATSTPVYQNTHNVPVNDTNNRMNYHTINLSTPLSFEKDETIVCRLYRRGSNGSDTAVGSFDLLGININYESDGPNSGGSGPYDISGIGY